MSWIMHLRRWRTQDTRGRRERQRLLSCTVLYGKVTGLRVSKRRREARVKPRGLPEAPISCQGKTEKATDQAQDPVV